MIRSADPDAIRPYLKDASNLSGGYADEVVFPEDEKEVAGILEEASSTKTPVTIAGNGTGLVGARIPFGGIVLSTEKLGGLRHIHQAAGEPGYAVTGPAITLRALQEAVSAKGLLYPPDPTEQNAFLGATVATNASGARTFKYGATRRWIRRLKVVLATGDILELQRGECLADKEGRLFLTGSRNVLQLKLPQYRMPEGKHSAGYYVAPGMSALDLFIGSEGTLGVITEIELALIPQPRELFSGIIFFGREEDAWQFANQARNESLKNRALQIKNQIDASALEYFDAHSLDALRSAYSQIPSKAQSAIFFEQEIQPDFGKLLREQWGRLCIDHQALSDQSWFSRSAQEHTEFRAFRHAIPVLVNRILRQHQQTKIGTDFTVPHEHLFGLFKLYRQSLCDAGLRYCIFGHVADNHLHVNLLPRNDQEADRGWAIYRKIAQQVIAWGGTISAEHGVGKIKREYLLDMFGQLGLREMAAMKKKLDPCLILGRGNIIPEEFLL
ncbi:MAG: FAD-binding oxidoreductase [Candidatus Brocadia sp.]|jgi:FAD/FMN-containing dehydrogenases|uniref:D-lactate dehydrogenase (cytochrome) n=1 Tax=Candidatus Brocadia fulgida TaxID=380242 RepID=A0A0M2UQJ8_9BACT|nr:MAG: putative D-lactate dehydrogenase [Candidatus Brocadia fulgida]MCC6324562.1 FAD-binding oxidoreductase [Candidatus Brocadia sp.]MCE7912403.1 FAD-binding oxidoreductase [Candidatus Brocadia sp. AMX3]MBV6518150.1 putative FAD-linked oxidoreductase [Candidatus Brocadia fulgida]MDG5995832.1 FAD-binding oxidoreductase [Candidatus Brocadia sp.]